MLNLYVGNANGTVLRYEQTQSAAAPTAAGALATPAPLPVTLTAFTGQAGARANLLRWATASEKNSARFVVERSATGSEFAALGSVAAAATSSAARIYEFADAPAPAAGTAYYRLRQEDLDGTVAHSPVAAVVRTTPALGGPVATAFPSPFAETLSVALLGAAEAVAATATLLTAAGQSIYRQALQLSGTPQALPGLPNLPAGLYVLRLATAAGTTTQKVVRQ